MEKNGSNKEKNLLEEKKDYQFSEAFIYDATQCSCSDENLENILTEVKCSKFYGDIKWPEKIFNSKSSSKLVKEIEDQLIANNNEFARFPSDFIHALMSRHAYNYEQLKIGDNISFNKETWRVHQIFCEYTGLIGEAKTITTKANRVIVYVAVLYMNESRKQLVLATKGIEASIFKTHFTSHDALSNSLKGVLCNDTIPQLYQCYKVTLKCVQIARQLDCFLSFTGFANGAWLAEHSLYYAHQSFEYKKSKAVLFDSPGMVKTEQDLENTGIISKEKKISLQDMNVINYLTAPCFANSCNQHVGIVYRLFVNEEKYNKFNSILKLEDRLKEVPALGWLVEKLSNELKNYKFFLIGLATMFNHSNLDLIIDEFRGGPNGKPKYFEKVEKWPVIKLVFGNSFGHGLSDNIQQWTSEKVEALVENAPIFGASILAKVAGKASGWAVDFGASKLLPGDYMLINILIELSKGTIEMDHFENPNFYLKISEREEQNELDAVNDKKVSEIPTGSDFSLSFEKNYLTRSINLNVKKLNPNMNLENNDFCLEKLHELKGELIEDFLS